MFDPSRLQNKNDKNEALKRVEKWCMDLMETDELRDSCLISVQEVVCGDPNCAPIDTLVAFTFQDGGQGMLSLPMSAKQITENDIKSVFPPRDIFEQWQRGEDAVWPPEPEDEMELQELRFDIGTHVLCRVGPTDWAAGTVIQLWYREPNWPEWVYAPYKILLEDGRSIFAPQDMDQIIRLNPNAPENSGSSSGEAAGGASVDGENGTKSTATNIDVAGTTDSDVERIRQT